MSVSGLFQVSDIMPFIVSIFSNDWSVGWIVCPAANDVNAFFSWCCCILRNPSKLNKGNSNIFHFLLTGLRNQMDNLQLDSIPLKHNPGFQFSCLTEYKSQLRMALPYKRPEHWPLNVSNLTKTPPWKHFHRTLKNFETMLQQNYLRMTSLFWLIGKTKQNSKWESITSTVIVIKVQSTNLAQFAIVNFAQLKLSF